MSLLSNLREMERAREAYWLRHPSTSPVKLRWRALTVRHSFHVLPGERVLELGAGSGLWTGHLSTVLRHQNPITAAVFNEDLARSPRWDSLPNISRVLVEDLDDLPAESFDYIVGTVILCHDLYPQNLQALYRLLKPGGSLLFFEANYWNPQVFLKNAIPALGRWAGQARCETGLRHFRLMQMASQQGFTHIDVVPYDIVHPLLPRRLVDLVQSVAFVFEHAPLIKELCGTLYIRAQRPGDEEARRPRVNLAQHREFDHAVSFVVPCHNEEMNIPRLVRKLVDLYGDYIHEIVIVNDNSRDRTAAVTRETAVWEPRVKLVDRTPPNGVGRALRDGYAAATGRYILTMDSDFVQILPELRDLFDAVAEGYDGAIGSRFTHESVMVNYPFFKVLCNRAFHWMARLLLPGRVHDVTNNLKLYRADVLRSITIDQPHFAANAETGLKPIMAGYRVKEVPVSWINRTIDMGTSSFRIAKVGPAYLKALWSVIWKEWRQVRQRRRVRRASPEHVPAKLIPGSRES